MSTLFNLCRSIELMLLYRRASQRTTNMTVSLISERTLHEDNSISSGIDYNRQQQVKVSSWESLVSDSELEGAENLGFKRLFAKASVTSKAILHALLSTQQNYFYMIKKF